jgi:hypothetical protein
MKKNILIISYGYPPLNDAGAQRPYAVAKNLDKSKFNVNVIVCENPSTALGLNKNFDPSLDGVSLIKIKSYVGGNTSNFKTNKVKKKSFVSSTKSLLFSIGQKLIFPDKGMFWFPNVKKYLNQHHDLIKNTDVVFSTSPGVTNHRIAQYIKRLNPNIQWIADFRDFNYVENWDSKGGLKSYLHKNLEKSLIKDATNLTFVTRTMLKAYQKSYPHYSEKMHCVYNGFDRADFPEIAQSNNGINKLIFFYAGSFYNGLRSPLPLMELLDKAFDDHLLTKENVELRIAGSLEEETESAMKGYKSYKCVNFLGSIPRAEVIKHMGQSTFLWLIVGNIKSHYQTIPIKLFEYIAARRPIINFAPIVGESSLIIQEKNLGYNFNTLDFDIAESYPLFKDLISKYKDLSFNKPMSDDNLDSFTWEKQINELENIIQDYE